MRQVRFEITDGICRPAGCETDDIGCAAISDAQCASEARKSSTASGGRISYGIVMTVTENGFNETTSFPDISFSRKKLRDFVSMLERNDVSPAHVEETPAPAADAAPPEEPAEEPTEPAEPAAAQTEEGGDQA